jgi:hypothetical protein
MGGGSKSTEVKIPQWLEDAGKEALARSRDVSRIPYAAYYGPDVAAMTPMQVAAMRGTNQMAEAFGSPTADVTAGMPPAQDYGGMSAYSAGPMYDAALAELERRQPGTYNAIMGQFIDPITGQMPVGATAAGGAGASANAGANAQIKPKSGGGGDYGGYGSAVGKPSPSGSGTGTLGLPDPMSGKITSVGPIGKPGGGGMGRGKG